MLTSFAWNCEAVIAQVLFWHFKNARESVIIDALAGAAKAMGATHLCATAHPPEKRVGRLYQKRGMREVEAQYFREL